MKITKKSQDELAEHSSEDLVYALMSRFTNYAEIGGSLTEITRFEEPVENNELPFASLLVDGRMTDHWNEQSEKWCDTPRLTIVKKDDKESLLEL